MRKKEEFSDQFGKISRQYLKGDIEKTEALIQAISLTVEVLVDVRTNLKAVEQAILGNSEQKFTIRNVNE